jgi:hypothetical protein
MSSIIELALATHSRHDIRASSAKQLLRNTKRNSRKSPLEEELLSLGMCNHAVSKKDTNISMESTASIFRVQH